MGKPVISHSEVECYSLCKRKHYYAFGEKLQKKQRSTALSRGILGHELFQVFWDNYSTYGMSAAKMILQNTITERFAANPSADLIYLAHTMQSFLEKYENRINAWRVISVEKEYRVDYGSFDYAFKPDLVVSEDGCYAIVDYKFVYDFYDISMFELAPQIPRYAGALRMNNIPASRGYYAFLRHRRIKGEGEDQRFKLASVPLSQAKISNAMSDIVHVGTALAEVKKLPLPVWANVSSRIAMQSVCKFCSFKQLCAEEFAGGSGVGTRAEYYEPSNYGYTETED